MGQRGTPIDNTLGGKSIIGAPNNLEILRFDSALNAFVYIASPAGQANTASNVGTGQGVFKQKTGVDLEFRSFLGGKGIAISLVVDDITIVIDTFLDNETLVFGTGGDATILYDGTDLIIDPKVVGVGILKLLSDLDITGTLTTSGLVEIGGALSVLSTLSVTDGVSIGGDTDFNGNNLNEVGILQQDREALVLDAAGDIAPTKGFATIDTFASAATDNCRGFSTAVIIGQRYTFTSLNDARDPTMEDTTIGPATSMRMAGSFTLTLNTDIVEYIASTINLILETSRSDNG